MKDLIAIRIAGVEAALANGFAAHSKSTTEALDAFRASLLDFTEMYISSNIEGSLSKAIVNGSRFLEEETLTCRPFSLLGLFVCLSEQHESSRQETFFSSQTLSSCSYTIKITCRRTTFFFCQGDSERCLFLEEKGDGLGGNFGWWRSLFGQHSFSSRGLMVLARKPKNQVVPTTTPSRFHTSSFHFSLLFSSSPQLRAFLLAEIATSSNNARAALEAAESALQNRMDALTTKEEFSNAVSVGRFAAALEEAKTQARKDADQAILETARFELLHVFLLLNTSQLFHRFPDLTNSPTNRSNKPKTRTRTKIYSLSQLVFNECRFLA